MTPIGITLSLSGQKQVSDGLKQVGADINNLGVSGKKLGDLSQGMGAAALTAGQLKMATQQLPMQFQDIVVSLQAGQQPLTVLLQQGSQLAGSFGGAGAAAKAMAGYVVGLINPLTVLAAGVAALGVAYYQGSKEQDAFLRSVTLTGNAAGVTVTQLQDYARQMSDVSGTQSAAAESLTAFVSAGVQAGQQLQRFAQTAMDWEKATGQSVAKTAEQFASLQKDPLAAVLKLNEGTNFLTVSVYEQVRALEAQGDKTAAAEAAMGALDASMRERAESIKSSLGILERAWGGITGVASRAWDAMLNVGRSDTLQEKIASVQAQLDKKLEDGPGLFDRSQHDKTIERLREQLWMLEAQYDQEILNAAAQREGAEALARRVAFDKQYAEALKEELTLQQKLDQARATAIAAGASEAEIKKVLAYVTEEHNKTLKKSGDGARVAQTSYQNLLATINQKIVAMKAEAQTGEKLTESEKLRARYQEELTTKGRKYTAQYRAQVEAALESLAAEEKQVDAARALAKAKEEQEKAHKRQIEQYERQVRSVEESVDKLRQEEDAHALATAENISHAEAMERLTIARLDEAAARLQGIAGSDAELERIQREIAARKELMGVLGQRAAREANQKAADQAAKDWDKTAQTIGDTLADYIMGGGKDAAQYLKRLFSTLVLQPIVQYGAQSLMGALGIGKAGDAVSAVLKGGNVGSEILNNAGLIGAGYQALFGASVGASTASLGFANVIGMAGGDALGALIAGNGGWAGVGSGASGAAGWFGAAAPWIAGIGALLAIIPSFLGGGTPHAGAASMYSGGEITGSGREYTKRVGVTETYQKEMQAPIDALARSIGGALDGLAEQFGGAVGYSVQVGFKSDNDDPSNGQYRVTDASGKILREWEAYQRGELGARSTGELYDRDPQKGFDQYLQSITAATIPIVQDIVPGWADDLLDQLSDSLGIADALERGDKTPWKQMTVSGEEAFAALQAMLAKIAQIDAAFDALGETMSIFSDLSDDMKTALLGAAGSIESLTAIASSYYSSVYSEEERLQAAAEKMDKVIADMGIFADRGGLSVYDKDAKAKLRQAVDELMAAGQGELAAQLMALAQSFVQIADKSAEAAETASQAADAFKRSAIDAALGDLEAAVERESELLHERVSAVQESIGALESMRSMLKSNADALYGTVSATAQMQAVQGMLYIEDALDAVRRGASLKDYSGLSDAVTAARGGLSTGVYATQFEKDRDALVLANQLSELEGAAGMQLSVEEQQLKALQEQIDYYARMLQTSQQLIDGIDTLIDSTLTPDAAYDILMRALRDDYEGAKVSVSTGPAVDAEKEKESNLEREIRIISDTDKPNYADKNIGDLVDEAAAKSFENIGKAFETIDTSKGGYEISSDKAYTDFLSKIIGGVADPDADFALIGKSLSDLVDSGVGQLSLDGKQLKTLSDQLSVSGRIAQGIEELSDKSLTPSSIEDMLMRIFFEEDEQVDVTGGPARDPSSGAVFGPGVSAPSSDSAYDDYAARAAAALTGGAAAAKQQGIKDAAKSFEGSGDVAGLWGAVSGAGGNQHDIAGLYGWNIDDIERVLREQGVPGFAAGGLHTGGLRLVGERGPELEVTGPARYWDASKTMQMLQGGSSGDARLWALIERLIEEQRAQAGEIVRLNSRVARVLERWDSGGMPQQRQEAAV